MSFFVCYLRYRRGRLLLWGLFVLIFLVSFTLYNLPVEAVLYPAAICLVLGVGVMVWDLCRVWQKHRQLSRLASLPGRLMEHLPAVQSQDDADYQAILEALRQEQQALESSMTIRFQDMVDYYTIWAHQIKTPIAAMHLTLQREDSPLSRQLSGELQRIEQYVEMVLAFLRLDSDSRDYLFREQELDPIIREAVKKFSGTFIRKRLRLCYEPVHQKVLTDEKWLGFVLEQVLSNALKYTHTGSITIDMEEPQTLCIRDTGIGIAPEDLPRVFEKSYTGYNGRRDKKASGIGLYLCKRICDNLGHRITISSAPDSGTVVRIFLDRPALQVE